MNAGRSLQGGVGAADCGGATNGRVPTPVLGAWRCTEVTGRDPAARGQLDRLATRCSMSALELCCLDSTNSPHITAETATRRSAALAATMTGSLLDFQVLARARLDAQ